MLFYLFATFLNMAIVPSPQLLDRILPTSLIVSLILLHNRINVNNQGGFVYFKKLDPFGVGLTPIFDEEAMFIEILEVGGDSSWSSSKQ
ncbi:hypothetical protein [Oceanobacillus salinisoli]|uniref:hypothetical protein n=1 Tax=Oceanobacillus salinisoli TaxID=2678611 RepID=UPI0012E0F0C6|nr:hypothetical protein [Oceanobacillus salinisoli]